jgi:hypothetical protein
VPTVVVVGEADDAVIHTVADLLASSIPGARKVVVGGADHMLPLRAPAELAGLVRDLVWAWEASDQHSAGLVGWRQRDCNQTRTCRR